MAVFMQDGFRHHTFDSKTRTIDAVNSNNARQEKDKLEINAGFFSAG
jgi:hypothetical protein